MPLPARTLLLTLSDSSQLKTLLARNRMSQGITRRFAAGETLPEALETARALQTRRICTALDLLGENVGSEREASEATDMYLAVLEALGDAHLHDGSISVKLTALGLDQSDTLALSNLRRIAGAAHAQNNAFVRVDMEGSTYTQRTLDIVRTAHSDYAQIATHDKSIICDAKRFVREPRIPNHRFEFQMLLGIRRDLQEALAAEGYGVRASVPFGQTWHPYFMRRLAEQPATMGFILKNRVRP